MREKKRPIVISEEQEIKTFYCPNEEPRFKIKIEKIRHLESFGDEALTHVSIELKRGYKDSYKIDPIELVYLLNILGKENYDSAKFWLDKGKDMEISAPTLSEMW